MGFGGGVGTSKGGLPPLAACGPGAPGVPGGVPGAPPVIWNFRSEMSFSICAFWVFTWFCSVSTRPFKVWIWVCNCCTSVSRFVTTLLGMPVPPVLSPEDGAGDPPSDEPPLPPDPPACNCCTWACS